MELWRHVAGVETWRRRCMELWRRAAAVKTWRCRGTGSALSPAAEAALELIETEMFIPLEARCRCRGMEIWSAAGMLPF